MSKNTIDLTQNVDDIIKNMAGIIENILLQAHPVGSYYFSDDPTDPGELFGGTWEALTPGYTLVAQGTATEQHGSTTWTKEFKAGQKYGEFEHQLTVGELPAHQHEMPFWMWAVSFQYNTGTYQIPLRRNGNAVEYNNGKSNRQQFVTATGGYGYHYNVSPCQSVYIWRRIS